MKRFKITTTQLARICGVSRGTVDCALHNRPGISAKTREIIKGSENGNSMLIGVVLFDLYYGYFSKLVMSLVSETNRVTYSIGRIAEECLNSILGKPFQSNIGHCVV